MTLNLQKLLKPSHLTNICDIVKHKQYIIQQKYLIHDFSPALPPSASYPYPQGNAIQARLRGSALITGNSAKPHIMGQSCSASVSENYIVLSCFLCDICNIVLFQSPYIFVLIKKAFDQGSQIHIYFDHCTVQVDIGIFCLYLSK